MRTASFPVGVALACSGTPRPTFDTWRDRDILPLERGTPSRDANRVRRGPAAFSLLEIVRFRAFAELCRSGISPSRGSRLIAAVIHWETLWEARKESRFVLAGLVGDDAEAELHVSVLSLEAMTYHAAELPQGAGEPSPVMIVVNVTRVVDRVLKTLDALGLVDLAALTAIEASEETERLGKERIAKQQVKAKTEAYIESMEAQLAEAKAEIEHANADLAEAKGKAEVERSAKRIEDAKAVVEQTKEILAELKAALAAGKSYQEYMQQRRDR